MARPRVFVSSTFYDLQHVRADVEGFINSIGYEPVMFERGAVAFREGSPRENQCYGEVSRCDIVVSIIGSSFGTESLAKPGSISHNEMRRAIEDGKQVYAFIHSDVQAAHRMYLRNKGNDSIDYGVDRRVLEFIEEVHTLPYLGIHPFTAASEIVAMLREQLANLFQELLETRGQVQQQQSVNRIADLAAKMEESFKTYGQLYARIWGFAHPGIAQLRDLLGLSFHVFFVTLRQCDALLSGFGFDRVPEAGFDDDDGYLHWSGTRGELKIAKRRMFDDKGALMTPPPRWNSDFIVLTPREDDEIPF